MVPPAFPPGGPLAVSAAPDGVNAWINSFLVAAMALFGAETLLTFLCRRGARPLLPSLVCKHS